MKSNPSKIQRGFIGVTTFGVIVIIVFLVNSQSQFFIVSIEQSFITISFKEEHNSLDHLNDSWENDYNSVRHDNMVQGLFKFNKMVIFEIFKKVYDNKMSLYNAFCF